jgi:hypothetical protein
MAKMKVLIPCVSCGSQLNKNGHCEFCRQEWKDQNRKFICCWCDREITDGELRGRGDEEGAPLFHLDCLVEREYIHEDIAYQNKFGGLLSAIFAEADKILKKEADKIEPPLVTGILVQMKATNWQLSSLIFDLEPRVDSEQPEDKSIVKLGPVADPNEVRELLSKMESENWQLDSLIFDTKSDEENNTPK